MKSLPSRASILRALISILIVSFFPSIGHSQNLNVYEQEGFSSQDKGKIADFYWQLSQELLDQKQFDEAIFQVQRVYELQPGDKKVASFIKNAKREKMNYGSSKEKRVRTFIDVDREQEDFRGKASASYLPIAAAKRPTYQPPVKLPRHINKEINKMLQRARMSYRTKNYSDALYYLNEILVMDSAHEDARALKDEILRRKTFVKTEERPSMKQMPDNRVAEALEQAGKEYRRKNYDAALFYLNAVLIWHPQNEEALEMKNTIIKERRSGHEDQYQRDRKKRAALFRERQGEEMMPDEERVGDREEYERMRMKVAEERDKEEKKREQLAEQRLREDVRRRIALQEKEDLDMIIQEVEESKFYETFQKYEDDKEQKKQLQRRQVHSFLLRTEGLMELGKYEEAAFYLNNVFMVEPYNERAQKMRLRLEKELVNKKVRERREYDKLFEEEKKEYKKIRERVRKEKIRALLNEADRLYGDDDLLTARQESQKVLILDPSNRQAKRVLQKIDKKLITLQEEIQAQEEAREERRSGAMEESFQEAARALEIELIKEKKESISVQERVRTFLAQADKRIELNHDYDGALVDLNRAYAIDPGNKKIMERIKKVRALKAQPEAKRAERIVTKPAQPEKAISIAVDKEEEAKEKEKRWKELNRGKQILGDAAQRSYQKKVQEYVRTAQQYLEEKQFDKAKTEIERIYMFDPTNPTAKEMLKQITEYEISYEKKMQEKSLEKEFEMGLDLERLKSEMQKEAQKRVVREPLESKIEDKKAQREAMKKLIQEGKSLNKQRRYYEALNKFEAVFAIDAQNKTASRYIDEIKETMLKEREEERKRFKQEQQKEINERLNEYSKEIQSLHKQGRYTEAAIFIEKGLLLDPLNKYLDELKKLNQKGSDEQMRRELSDDEKVSDLVNIAIKEFIQGNYVESKKYFEKVLEINPDDEKAKNSLAKIDEKLKSLNVSK